jgi:hypothetical protein
MCSQYQADRLIAGFSTLRRDFATPDKSLGKMFAGHLTRLRRGYNAIRRGFDYDYDCEGAPRISQWLTRSWAEMTLAALAIGFFTAYRKDPYAKKDEVQNLLIGQVKWLNKRERLIPLSPHKLPMVPGYHTIDSHGAPSVFDWLFTGGVAIADWAKVITEISDLCVDDTSDPLQRFEQIKKLRKMAADLSRVMLDDFVNLSTS